MRPVSGVIALLVLVGPGELRSADAFFEPRREAVVTASPGTSSDLQRLTVSSGSGRSSRIHRSAAADSVLGGTIKISAPLVVGGDVTSFSSSLDGSRVVYLADQDVDGSNELYSVSVHGGAVVRLNPPLIVGGDVADYAISGDGERVVFRAEGVEGVDELYSVPIGGGAATKLNGAMTAGGDVLAFLISLDSSRVVYRADQNADAVDELFSVPIAGGTATKISGVLTPGGGVSAFQNNADGSRTLYLADQITDGVVELFSVPLVGGAVTKLSPTPVAGGDVVGLTASGTRALYRADQDVDEVFEFYSVPDTGGSPVKLNGPLTSGGDVFSITPAGVFRAYYRADQDTDNFQELYSVPIAGGTAVKLNTSLEGSVTANPVLPEGEIDVTVVYQAMRLGVVEIFRVAAYGGASTKLNGPLVSGGSVALGAFAALAEPEGRLPYRAFYLADQHTDEVLELYGVPLSGGTAVKLNGPLVPGGDVRSARLSAHGQLVYLADGDINDVVELYAGTTMAVGPITKLNPAPVLGGDVVAYETTGEYPDPMRVVFIADLEADEVFELYSVGLDGDADGDSVADGLDCAAFDGAVWGKPGEVTNLGLSHTGAGGTTTLTWDAPAELGGTSVVYDTLRSFAEDDFLNDTSCIEMNGTDTTATDTLIPPVGTTVYYLVRAEGDCGRGTLGQDSSSAERSARTCP